MPLPAAWVDRIHARLLVRYGADWLRMWEGIDIDAVKADWASELNGLSVEAIGHGLRHLPPDRPPKVDAFRALCLTRLEPASNLLAPPDPSVKVDPARVKAVADAARAITGRRGDTTWIDEAQADLRAGRRVSPGRRVMLRLALAKGSP